MTRQLFFAEGLTPPAHTLAVGDSAILSGSEAHHMHVKRIEGGEEIDLVDGQGLRLTCQALSVAKSAAEVRVVSVVQENQPSPRITLVQALSKNGRDEQAIEMATEVGADAVIPWQADRSQVRWVGTKAEKGQTKWTQVVAGATKQSRRSFQPDVRPVMGSKALTQWIADVTATGGVVFICHEEATEGIVSVLRERGQDLCKVSDIGIVIGPEGGISPAEIDAFMATGAQIVLLGPHIQRASSAGSVACALICAAVGRW